MAQRTEKEETEFKVVPETITPCINASTATTTSSSPTAVSGGVASSVTREKSPRSRSSSSAAAASQSLDLKKEDDRRDVKEEKDENRTVMMKREVNRCLYCRRRVGLTGFRCRCGEMFCSQHRYSDRHDCSYDYKAAGRDAIARENPVVRAAKIIKI